jgi:anthranilate phosphoribosyltransferase
MSDAPLAGALERLARSERLSRRQMRLAMDAIMSGEATPAQIGAFLMGLRIRGETLEEIAGAADSLRAHARRIVPDRAPLLDTCGTGGDGSGTFNISTTAAFVVAGAGVAVAKHGNRSVSSRCGSADVLEAMGARIDLPPEGTQACLEATGVGFLYAPLHHGAMRHAAAVRKDLGLRTLFNLLGPLCNPAGAGHQLMGVYDPALTEPLARVLGMLGSAGAMVVHGAGGLDEISLAGPTQVAELRDGEVSTYTLTPGDYGIPTATMEALHGGDAVENAAIVREVLDGVPGPRLDVVLLNAGAALAVAEKAPSIEEGIALARGAVASGKARESCDAFIAFTRGWEE